MIQWLFCTLPNSFSGNRRQNEHSQNSPNKQTKKGDHRIIKNKYPNIALEIGEKRPTKKYSCTLLWKTAQCSTRPDVASEGGNEKDIAQKTVITALVIVVSQTK